jgi:RNA polymerase sigma-70 factor (ECF subfamily)
LVLMTTRDMTVSDVERLAGVAEAETALAMTEEAFRAFYDRTARPVWGYLARLTGDRALADDLLQETFYRFLRSGAVHESEAHRRNTLFKIATNLARDAHRRQRVRPFFVGAMPDVPSREDAAATFEQTTDVGRAMRAFEAARPRDALARLRRRIVSSGNCGRDGCQDGERQTAAVSRPTPAGRLLGGPAVKGGA